MANNISKQKQNTKHYKLMKVILMSKPVVAITRPRDRARKACEIVEKIVVLGEIVEELSSR